MASRKQGFGLACETKILSNRKIILKLGLQMRNRPNLYLMKCVNSNLQNFVGVDNNVPVTGEHTDDNIVAIL